jgi:hypothetical protein
MRVHHIGNVNKVIAVLGEHGVSQQKKNSCLKMLIYLIDKTT